MNIFNKRKRSRTSESGYTILESLVAMIVVAVLMSAVSPIIILSVGMRVQARKAELAAQAARSYIDALRSQTIDPPGLDTGADVISVSGSLTTPCPAGTYCSDLTLPSSGQFYCVDGDGDEECTTDSLTDMLVYSTVPFTGTCATNYNDASDKSELNYPLSVRVYRAKAFQDAKKIATSTPSTYINNAGLATRTVTGGEIIEKAMFSTQTEMVGSDDSYQQIWFRLNNDCN